MSTSSTALFADEAKALGHRHSRRDVLPLLAGDLRPRDGRRRSRHARRRFKVGCITNNAAGKGAGSHRPRAATSREIIALFDHVIESSKAGVRKPDPRIYVMMCEALHVARQPASISTTSAST